MLKQIWTQLFVKNKPVIGLDIGKSEIKMVLLEGKSLNNMVFKNYATQSILIEKRKEKEKEINNQNSDPLIEEMEKKAKAIAKCWKKLDTSVKDVVIALPSPSIITKKSLVQNFETKEELEEAVQTEIENTMPLSIEEINLDFQVFGPNEASPTENDITIWATRKEKVEEAVAVVEQAGLNPVILDIEHCAIYNALAAIEDKIVSPNTEEQETNVESSQEIKNISIVIDLSYSETKMIVFKNTDVYNRENEQSLSVLNKMIMNRFDYESISEVEKNKKSHQLPVEYKLEILPEFLNTYARDIARGINFYFSSTASNPRAVKGIYLTGGGASLEGLVPAVKKAIEDEALKKRVALLSIPFYLNKKDNLSLSVLQKEEYSLTVACGLALRRFLKK